MKLWENLKAEAEAFLEEEAEAARQAKEEQAHSVVGVSSWGCFGGDPMSRTEMITF